MNYIFSEHRKDCGIDISNSVPVYFKVYGYTYMACKFADLQPYTTYTIKRFDYSNRFRVATFVNDVKNITQDNAEDHSLVQGWNTTDDVITFTTGADDLHLCVYYSNNSEFDTRIMLVEGSAEPTVYEEPTLHFLPYWKMGTEGHPVFTDFIPLVEKPISKEYPAAFWRIDPMYNYGNPFHFLIPSLHQLNLWIQKQQPLIHVYGTKTTKQEDFNTNGYAILEPISCEVYQETNGEYSATFEAYCDEYKKFTYLKNQAHVKLPIMYHGTLRWQIFRAAIVNRIMNDDGTYRIKAYCPHNFYANNRFLIKDARPTQMYGGDALNYICTHDLYNDERYPFYYSSDIQIRNTAYYERMSITRALLGADQSFVNRWGGKLYRDNFYFSINKETENYKDAGVIAYGYNMTAIDFETDDTEVITNLIARDNFGNEVILSIPSADMTVAERIYSYVHFSYDEEDKAALRRDAQAYLENFKQSKVNIKVNFLNLADIDLYKDFISLDAYEVGDKVTIYHKDLDIYYSNLEIIQKRYDVVAQRTTEVVIGNFKDAINRSAFMSGTASSGQSATDKNIIAVSDATTIIVASQSIDGMQQFPVGTIERFSIAQLEGGTIS